LLGFVFYPVGFPCGIPEVESLGELRVMVGPALLSFLGSLFPPDPSFE
jgi:hypothetical protein